MARLNMTRFAVVGVVALATSGALFSAACSSDSNPSPGNNDASMGSGGKSNSTGGKSNSTGGKSNGGSTGNKDGGTGGKKSSGGSTGDGGPSAGGSTNGGDSGPGAGGSSGGDSGTPPSSTCPPDSNDFYTDKCTDSKCTPFDNSKLEKLTNGKLPALP